MMKGRNENGQFEKGKSGNPAGRPRKRSRHRTTAGHRLTVLEVGDTPVQVVNRETGETEEISLLRANMLALGRKGASGHVGAAKAFLAKHAEAAGIHGEITAYTRALIQELSRLELENEKLQSLLPKNGGVIHREVPEADWSRLAGVKEEAWRNRKGSVEPRL